MVIGVHFLKILMKVNVHLYQLVVYLPKATRRKVMRVILTTLQRPELAIRRWISNVGGECQIYSRQDKETGTNIGVFEKRRAVVESKIYQEWSSGNDAGNTYESTTYSYGELYILVIAKK